MGCVSSCLGPEDQSGNHPADHNAYPRPSANQRNAPEERRNSPGQSVDQRSAPDESRDVPVPFPNQPFEAYELRNPHEPSGTYEQTNLPDTSESSDIVVSVDFGTTYSGFAYARASVTPPEINIYCEWPGANSARAISYCKNQTSLLYLRSSGARGSFELKAWGWSAFLAYDEIMQDLVRKGMKGGASTSPDQRPYDMLNPTEGKEAFFATKFKLYLAPETAPGSSLPSLPPDLTVERLVVDYLRIITDYAVQEVSRLLQKKLTKGNIQWCLTVPAIWDERAKQLMRRYAEMAGMIQGPDCPTGASASPRPLYIILEPEAASAFLQDGGLLNISLTTKDRVLVADVGGGTIDLVVHEVTECRPGAGALKVKEVVPSYGALGGGSFVDINFFNLVKKKVPCYLDFCLREYPALPLQLFQWWQKVKLAFDGSRDFCVDFNLINSGLYKAWMEYDRERHIHREEREYWNLRFDFDDFKHVFDTEVVKVIDLIAEKIDMVQVLMVVGGFAASPYLKRRIYEHFEGRRQQIVIPVDPGRAICVGGVWLYLNRSFIQSRISRKTYGVSTVRHWNEGDPENLAYKENDGRRMCRDVFSAFVRAGDQVNLGESEERYVSPSNSYDRFLNVDIYSSSATDPLYTTDRDVRLEGSFQVDISDGMELGTERLLKLSMVWGDSLISVTATPKNFGDQGRQKAGLEVRFESH
ncbi:hypothetical protein KP509_34G013600 [Ceratopteris richardii]|uniref:Uncharacterized protein n=4 Tax=Ceratopteris richardii TaxID=49495 RepID=A0A8T2QIZ9_CERRI|nr:hypothetical protein KP509_34G013600 [Ceratopteris richardii]